MIDIVIIFYLIFPIFMIPFVRKADAEKSVLFTKEDSNMIKGIASLCIIMAHMSDMLRRGGYNEKWLQPFSVLGGIGVLLFFFLSGYGIYKGYGIKKIDFTFIMNRFVKIYFVSVIIKAVLAIPNIAVGNGEGYLVYCLWGDWFVDVIMLQYILFYVAKKISEICKKENIFEASGMIVEAMPIF